MAKATATKEHFDLIELDLLKPSPTNPRTTFTEELLDELVESIKQHGIIEPLIVRVDKTSKGFFEIVCGHRRYHASIKAGLKAVPCVHRVLTDDQVTDQQIHENLKREDLNPIDEAKTYLLMRDKGATLAEIVARAGRGETYVGKRLQLTNLIEVVAEDVKAGYLPLTQAVEISKYPQEIQESIHENLYATKWVHPETGEEVDDGEDDNYYEDDEYEYDDDGNLVEVEAEDDPTPEAVEAVSVQPVEVVDKTELQMGSADIARFVQSRHMLALSAVPFALDATDLREDGLACVACPQRTGANAGLFEVNSEADYCLNRKCYIGKRVAFINITRTALAKDLKAEVDDVPVISANWQDGNLLKEELVMRNGGVTVDPEDEDEDERVCEFTVKGMNTRGEVGLLCFQDSGCTKHHWHNRYRAEHGDDTPQAAVRLTAEEMAEAEAKKKRDRREEIFDVKVGEVVRVEVVKQVAEKFAKIGLGALSDFTDVATARMWQTVNFTDERMFKKFCEAAGLELVTKTGADDLRYEETVAMMEPEAKAKLLIVLSHYWKGDMRYNQYKSQKGIRALAAEFKINYALIDAEQRVAFSSKKNKKKFEAYLQQVEVNDPAARVPRVYSEDYICPDDRKTEPVVVEAVEAEDEPCEACEVFLETEGAHGTSYTDEEMEAFHLGGHDVIDQEVEDDGLAEIADELDAMFDDEEVSA